jgi:hypothetical protein
MTALRNASDLATLAAIHRESARNATEPAARRAFLLAAERYEALAEADARLAKCGELEREWEAPCA